jgi:enterochelin esterase-like enzyme
MNSTSYKPINNNFIYCLLFVFILFIAQIVNGSILENHSIQSKILQQPMKFFILLPDNYYLNNQKFPVIYLLHGMGGDGESWIKRCAIKNQIDSLTEKHLISEFIYVMPDAQNSYYMNNYDNSFCYEDYFIKELTIYIDSVYHTLPGNENHTLMGLSMGGFGAALLGTKYPDKFGSIVIMSGALRDSSILVNMSGEEYDHYYGKVIGPDLTGKSRITEHWKLNSPYYLIDSISAVPLRKTHWYIECGMSDARLPANDAFHKLLMKYNIPHQYYIRPGNHNWEFWCNSTSLALIYLTSLPLRISK